MYNLELVFVTPVKVKIIDKSFEKMLGEISGCGNYALPYVAREITNTLTIENTAKIPSKSAIAEIAQTLNKTLRETLENSEDINVEIAGDTTFTGFTNIEEV